MFRADALGCGTKRVKGGQAERNVYVCGVLQLPMAGLWQGWAVALEIPISGSLPGA